MENKNTRLYVETDRLKLILSEHKEDIGKKKSEGIEKIVTAIAFAIPMALSDFTKWNTIGLVV